MRLDQTCPSPPHVSKTPPHTHLVLGQVGSNGFDFVVEDVVLLHLAVHQRKVSPEALAAQLVLEGRWRDTRKMWAGADFGIPHRSLGFWPQLGECLFPNFFWSKWWQVSIWTTADAHGLNLAVTCGTLVTVLMLQVDTLLTVDVPQRHQDVAATSFAVEEMSFSSLPP